MRLGSAAVIQRFKETSQMTSGREKRSAFHDTRGSMGDHHHSNKGGVVKCETNKFLYHSEYIKFTMTSIFDLNRYVKSLGCCGSRELFPRLSLPRRDLRPRQKFRTIQCREILRRWSDPDCNVSRPDTTKCSPSLVGHRWLNVFGASA